MGDAYDAVQLRVQFYTSQRSGLLFLAAGQTDYLLLELHAGVLEVSPDVRLSPSRAAVSLNNSAAAQSEGSKTQRPEC